MQNQALDWQLDRFYYLCLSEKPHLQNSLRLNNANESPAATGSLLNQLEIGQEFFGQFVEQCSPAFLVDWFLQLFFRIPIYLHNSEVINQSKIFPRQGLQFEQFFVQVFLLFMKTAREEEKKQQNKTKDDENEQSKNLINDCDEAPVSQYCFTKEQQKTLLRILICIDFPMYTKIWSLIMAAGVAIVYKSDTFPTLVKEAADAGKVAFWAIQYAISRFGHAFDDVSILAKLLLLGRVNARLIENFLCNRDQTDRDKARVIILTAANQWAKNVASYKNAMLINMRRSDPSFGSFDKFQQDMVDLVAELRREIPRCNVISLAWARTALRKNMKKCYIKQECSIEQLYDLIYVILKQRIHLRKDVVEMLRRNKDLVSAEYWSNFFVDYRIHHFQEAIVQPKKNSPPKEVYCVNDDVDMHEVRGDFLSIPEGIDVLIVDKVAKLLVVEHHIRQCENSKYALVGLDSEWSPYVLSTRASILQIAFHSVVFILDLDSMERNEYLVQFVNKLFANPNILKIGFKFGEDLLQLRKTLPNCGALYEPADLIDMSRVVSHLISLSINEKLPIDEFIKFPTGVLLSEEDAETLKPDTEVDLNENKIEGEHSLDEVLEWSDFGANRTSSSIDEKTETSTDADMLAQKTSDRILKNERRIKNLSLSSLCQYMLGKPLDKSEQCSVWTRRPLRKLQMRYAALDAFSILMLYDRCVEWASKLGLKIEEITDAQERISVPLPLFFDRNTVLNSAAQR